MKTATAANYNILSTHSHLPVQWRKENERGTIIVLHTEQYGSV